MKQNHRKNIRRCIHCGQRFIPDPRVSHCQHYCHRFECQKASRAASQRRWRSKHENQDHFRGPINVANVQAWRKANPGYWRKKTRLGHYRLQGTLAEVVEDFALQDMTETSFSLVIGLLSHLTNSALKDEIAKELKRLILRGHGILTDTTANPP